jgi:hypothetical protein
MSAGMSCSLLAVKKAAEDLGDLGGGVRGVRDTGRVGQSPPPAALAARAVPAVRRAAAGTRTDHARDHFGGPFDITVGERSDPVIAEPSYAIVRVVLGCVCGSDARISAPAT